MVCLLVLLISPLKYVKPCKPEVIFTLNYIIIFFVILSYIEYICIKLNKFLLQVQFKTFQDLAQFLIPLSGTRFNYIVLEFITPKIIFKLCVKLNLHMYETYTLGQ